MPSVLSTGTNALLAFQRALATTSHNVANIKTEGYSRQKVDFATRAPTDAGYARVGNGTMIALVADSREKVDAVHKLALELGGKDEGAVGLRGEHFYGGYFRDLDGNKLVVYKMG